MEEIKEILDKLNNRISNLEFKVANLELKETEDTVRDERKLQMHECYFYVDLDVMEVNSSRWEDEKIDNTRLKHRVIFKTEEEADEYLEYLKEKEEHMNTFTEEEWQDEEITKYFYYYHNGDCELKCSKTWFYRYIKPYFRTEAETKNFIQKYEWQIKHELVVK